MARLGIATVRGDASWQSRVFFNPFKDDIETQGAYGLVHLRAGFEPRSRRWEMTIYIRNVGNREYITGTANVRCPPTQGARASRATGARSSRFAAERHTALSPQSLYVRYTRLWRTKSEDLCPHQLAADRHLAGDPLDPARPLRVPAPRVSERFARHSGSIHASSTKREFHSEHRASERLSKWLSIS
jgi:hypothetical protein